jgi:hypothetical protein
MDMQNQDLIREIAAKAFSEALQEKSLELAEDVARRMNAALQVQGPGLELQPVQAERTKELHDGTMLISGSRTQTETLETLLAASSALTPSCGLLVLRGAQATGYSCIGLAAIDNFKRATMDCSKGVATTVISSCSGRAMKVSDLDPAFTSRLGLVSSQDVLLLPVLLKERVAALLIALAPQRGDLEGMEVLVQVAQLVMDVQAYRKMAQLPAAAPRPAAVAHPAAQSAAHPAPQPVRAAPPPTPPADPMQTRIISLAQPSAAQAPAPDSPPTPPEVAPAEMATPASASAALPVEPEAPAPPPVPAFVAQVEPEAPVPSVTAPPVEPAYSAATAAAPQAAPAYRSTPAPSYTAPVPPPVPVYTAPPAPIYTPTPAPSYTAPEQPPAPTYTQLPRPVVPQDEAHDKARRFAKLLVEEIKLYNQTKVGEGRAQHDLYSRLRDDIEKSRAAYQKRYGDSVRDVDYFTQELVRILADNNLAVMGAGFPG